MKINGKKMVLCLMIFLIISLSFSPVFNAKTNSIKKIFPVNISSFDEKGEIFSENWYLDEKEIDNFQIKMQNLEILAKNQSDLKEIIELIMQVFNSTNYPVLSRILTRIIDIDLLLKGKIVISKGWTRQINPLNDGEISFMKIISIFRYREDREILNIPCSSSIIDLDPFDIKSYSGDHLFLLYRFKGIFLQITRPFPDQNFCFIFGVSRFASAVQL